ncbi:MAG: hypothetical protein HYZ54_14280 [Ignavibacteriae bacterium]|nr:hypothetical protein [Ignavibacteriota bacterium]
MTYKMDVGIIYTLHSHFRWLVLTFAVITILLYLHGWFSKRNFSKVDRIMGVIFVSTVDLQVLLGIVNLISIALITQELHAKQIEHIATMVAATILIHVAARWKKKPDTIRFKNTVIFYFVALVLIFNGIIRLRGGLTW